MKTKLTRDVQAAHRATDDRILTRDDGYRYWPAGTVLDDPVAWRLVGMGNGVPADEECRDACIARGIDLSDTARMAAFKHQELVEKGIHPDDYEAFNNGEMVGYDGNGDPIPGPYYKGDDDE